MNFLVGSVAERRSGGRLAAAPGDLFLFGDLHDLRGHTRGTVRSVAERLFFGHAAGAPGIGTRLDVHDIGMIMRFFGHNEGIVKDTRAQVNPPAAI